MNTDTITDLQPVKNIQNKKINKDDEFIGLYELGFVLRRRGSIYEDNGRITDAEILYKLSIGLNNIYALNNLAIMYEHHKYPAKMIETTYLQAISVCDDSDPIFNFADYYKNVKRYGKMVKYYKMAIDKNNDIESMLSLSVYYNNKGDVRNTNKYLKMAFKDHYDSENYKRISLKLNLKELLHITEFCKNKNINTENAVFKYIMSLYNKNDDIIIYKNKITLFTRLNNVIECGVCLEEKLNIDLKCAHCVCCDCYLKLLFAPCPYCRR